MAKKPLTTNTLLLAELRGLRKDLVVFCHLLLRQQKMDGQVRERVLTLDSTKAGKSKVTANVLNPLWPDPIYDLDSLGESKE